MVAGGWAPDVLQPAFPLLALYCPQGRSLLFAWPTPHPLASFSGLKHTTFRKTSHRKSRGWLLVLTSLLSALGIFMGTCFHLYFLPVPPPAAPSQSLETCSEGGEGLGQCLVLAVGSCASWSCCHSGPVPPLSTGLPGVYKGCFLTSHCLNKMFPFFRLESCEVALASPMHRDQPSPVPVLIALSWNKKLRSTWLFYPHPPPPDNF